MYKILCYTDVGQCSKITFSILAVDHTAIVCVFMIELITKRCVEYYSMRLSVQHIPHFHASLKQQSGFPMPCAQWIEIKGGIVRFIDIGGIVDHQCLNFLFIINTLSFKQIVFTSFVTNRKYMYLHFCLLL